MQNTTTGDRGDLVNVKQLASRWQKDPRQVRQIIREHLDILRPIRVGRPWLVAWENIHKFEQQQRVLK